MKKLTKTIFIAGGAYMVADFVFHLGKAHMLGVELKYDVSPEEIYDHYLTKKYPGQLIKRYVKYFTEKEESK